MRRADPFGRIDENQSATLDEGQSGKPPLDARRPFIVSERTASDDLLLDARRPLGSPLIEMVPPGAPPS